MMQAAATTQARITLAIPSRSDEPALGRTLARALADWSASHYAVTHALEVVVCVNGTGAASSVPLADLRSLAARRKIPLAVVSVDRGETWPPPVAPLGLIALLTERAGKPLAWNLLRCGARSEFALFLDADVEMTPGAIGALLDVLARTPQAAVVSPRTACAPRDSLLERILAVPYAIDWPNLSGQLYAARLAALPERMPEDMIIDERWLELTVGRSRVRRVPEVRVVVRLPATLRDFVRQRVRIEMGKLQLERHYPVLLDRGAPQPDLRQVYQSLGGADRIRAVAYLALRHGCRLLARRRWRRGRTAGIWRQAATTKRWEEV